MFLTKTRKSGGRGAGGGVGTACRAGLRPRSMGGGLECWVKHGVGSRCGPYTQSERPRAAKKIICVDVYRGDFAGSWEGWGVGVLGCASAEC